MICNFWAVATEFFLIRHGFWVRETLLQTKAALIASLNLASFRLFLSKNKAFEQIHMFQIKSCAKQQLSSRSKLTTCLRKGRLLRFQLNSTATSDGGAQKLGNDLWQWPAWFWIDVNQSLQPDQSKNEKRFVWKPYRGLHWLDELWFSALRFFQQSATEKNHFPFYTVTDQASITWSWSSIQNLNFKFSLFCGSLPAWWALSKECVKRKYLSSNRNLCRMQQYVYRYEPVA